MSIYLHDIPLVEAQALLQGALSKAGLDGILGSEELQLDEKVLGRVLSSPVWARISSPHYHASAMDGFALRSAQVASAQPGNPVTLLCGEQAQYVDTGDGLPAWADAVLPIEQVEPLDENDQAAPDPRAPYAVRVRSAVAPWSHIRPMGEDIVATQLVLPSGVVLSPVDLGTLAASGASKVQVSRKPLAAVIPTGSELVRIGEDVKPGQIIEFNSLVMAAQLSQWGAQVRRYPITPDNAQQIKAVIMEAAPTCDIVLINAGSSAGSEDFTAAVIQELGEVLVHGVAVRPGHPVILGMIRCPGQSARMIPVVGVPGYPVSAALTMEIFVEPVISLWLGRKPASPPIIVASLTRKITSPPGDDDYVRVVVGKVGEKMLAAPLPRGAGVITSLSRADGLVIVPRGIQGLEAGSQVEVHLKKDLRLAEHTIFAVGSHDLTLDVLAQHLGRLNRRLVSSNVGSQGGLLAIRRGETHLAGTHLLDPETGSYNLAAVTGYLHDLPVRLIVWAEREQGLIVQKGNPKGITGLQDLATPGISFINRQRGSGTRVLLDYHLEQLQMDANLISGYAFEEYTHLAVASAVSSGRADCGLGITAAAKALDLDFIPLFNERYDLAVPAEFFDSEVLAPLFQIIDDAQFRKDLDQLSGYNFSRMGELVL